MPSQLVRQTLIDELKPGDILLYSKGNPLARMIRLKTWSRFSHCEVYLGNEVSAAARGSGVNTYLLDSDFQAILRPEVPSGYYLDISEAKSFHQTCIGQKYDILGLFRFFTIGKQSQDKQFCSELATRICRHYQICSESDLDSVSENSPAIKFRFRPFAERYDADLVSPGMFYSSPNFDLVWEDKGNLNGN